ncbi:MAG TPA: fasciclin domain-containing protein [Actinomycetota bacterium]|nr:fasciclin domain-containing protein [Actinomycetota bacterium]
MRGTRKLMIGAFAALAVVAAACTSDGDDGTAAAPTAASSPSMEAEMQASDTITDLVAGDERFSTLLAAVEAADLGETLAGEGPFTVFAPTNEAFEALPQGTLDDLLMPENQEALAGILTYHVVPAEVMAADVASGEVETVNGAAFEIEVADAGVTITDGQGGTATVVETDIAASNGVIHVIDAVLLPPEA